MLKIALIVMAIIIVLELIGFFIYKKKIKLAKTQNSLNNFEVITNPSGIIACIFFIFIFVCSAYVFSKNGDNNSIGFFILSFCLSIVALNNFKSFKVEDDKITYSQLLLPKKINCTFSDITNYLFFDNVLTLYNGKNKILSVNKYMIGFNTLVERLNKEKIKNNAEGTNVRTIKKKDVLFKNKTANLMLILFSSLGLVYGVIVIAISVGTENIMKNIYTSVGVILLLFCIALVYMFFLTIPNYKKISKIENGLNINFDEEMKKLGVTWFNYIDEKWYIDSMDFIVNRDYMISIEKIIEWTDDPDFEDSYNFHFKTKDDTIIKSTTHDKDSFKEWFEKKDE